MAKQHIKDESWHQRMRHWYVRERPFPYQIKRAMKSILKAGMEPVGMATLGLVIVFGTEAR